MSYVIGLDIGTTSTIGILLRMPGTIVAIASRPVELHAPAPGWAEEDPRQWWANVCAITRELLAHAADASAALAGIGVAGMVPAVVLLDAQGRLLRRSIQQSDGRSAAEIDELAREMDPHAFLARTGNGLNQQIVATKLRWIERHEPDVFARIATVFGSYDYINWCLTGERSLERNWALEAGFIDVGTDTLSDALLALAHLVPSALPPVHPSQRVVGRVTREAAAATGLPAGVPVVAGTADHVASAFAAGVVDAGDVLLKFGGAGDILLATEHAVPDARVFLDYHVVPGRFMPNGCMASTGSALNWLATGFAAAAVAGDPAPHRRLDELARDVPAGSDGLVMLPYLLGEKSPVQDPNARGVFAGLSLSHGIPHLWRAALEGTAYAFRHHVEVFRELGYPVQRLMASDGGSNSAVWMQIVADVLQAPVQLLTGHPGSCLGAAWVAAVGSGLTEDWGAVSRFVGQGRLVEPRSQLHGVYDSGYGQFRSLYEQLRPWFARRSAG